MQPYMICVNGITHQVMLTGDRQQVADHVAGQLSLDAVQAEALPQDKLQRISDECEAGRPLVVGDGINDAWPLRPVL